MSTTEAIATLEACPQCGSTERTEKGQCAECKRFLPGHTAALRHGARAGIALEAAADQARADLLDCLADGGIGTEPRFRLALEHASKCLARVRLHEAWLAEHGWTDGRGRLRVEAQLYERACGEMTTHLDRLALQPVSASKLGFNLARARQSTLAAEIAAERARTTTAAPTSATASASVPAPTNPTPQGKE